MSGTRLVHVRGLSVLQQALGFARPDLGNEPMIKSLLRSAARKPEREGRVHVFRQDDDVRAKRSDRLDQRIRDDLRSGSVVNVPGNDSHSAGFGSAQSCECLTRKRDQ